MTDFYLALDYLSSQSAEGIIRLFWLTLAFEVPRYMLGFVTLGLAAGTAERQASGHSHADPVIRPAVSVMVIGHNEAGSLERCLRSLQEQTLRPVEVVVVSDGSSDGMAALAGRMVHLGLAQHALATDLRSGKSAGMNLALHACRGDVVVNVDCDCSYDRYALENIVAPFSNPDVGAVSGDLTARNAGMSLVAQMQEIEYLLSLSVGRRVSAGLNLVSCVSGAFGAFRRTALDQVGGADVGGGEDLDLTLRLRAAGWRVVFAPTATCYTDVPVRLWTLVRQRLRWERDAIRIRCRKHRRSLWAAGHSGSFIDAAHQWDFLLFEVLGTAAFPFYLAWLFSSYGGMALPILAAMQAALLMLDVALLAVSALVVPRGVLLVTLLYMPGYSIYSGWVMRPVRLLAYVQEWFLFGSRHDNYLPAKARLIRKW